jgi:hypothetical protein
LLKEICNRLAGVESKLTKLDSIEERINSQFKHFDSELVSFPRPVGFHICVINCEKQKILSKILCFYVY